MQKVTILLIGEFHTCYFSDLMEFTKNISIALLDVLFLTKRDVYCGSLKNRQYEI